MNRCGGRGAPDLRGLRGLADEWRARASFLRQLGLGQPAAQAEHYANALDARLDAWVNEALCLADASQESGLAYSTLQQRVSGGTIRNAGMKGSPRIRRGDLPYAGQPLAGGATVGNELVNAVLNSRRAKD